MERTRVAGIIFIDGKLALMHRKNVIKRPEMPEYYTIPGGGLEEGETVEECVVREIKEEFGIDVRVIKKLYEMKSEKFNQREIFFLCKYISGEFGTGDGPEFSGNLKYIDSGEYIPELIEKMELQKINLLPPEIKKNIIKDINEGIL